MSRFRVAAAVALALVSGATAALPATGKANKPVVTHKLIVAAEKSPGPAAEKMLAVLVLISQNGGAPAGAVATPGKPLTVLLADRGLYRLKAEIDSACTGSCDASSRISGSADHRLELVPKCQPKGLGFACSKVEIVRVY